MSCKNLLRETCDFLASKNLTPYDVLYVTDGYKWCDWNTFANAAQNIVYDAGYGGQEINHNLKIVGRQSWWIERREYDGAEWWSFKEPVCRPRKQTNIPILLEEEIPEMGEF